MSGHGTATEGKQVDMRASAGTWVLRIWFALAFLIHLLALYSPGSGEPGALPGLDKLGHFGMFAALVTPLLLLGSPVGWTLLIAALYGGASEVIQAFGVPRRAGEFGDWAADLLGIALAWAIWRAVPVEEPGPEAPGAPRR